MRGTFFAFFLAACTSEEGDGHAEGYINVDNCWTGSYLLSPTFFAAQPYRDTLGIRLQNGADIQTYSDAINLQIDDVSLIRDQFLNSPLAIGLSPAVTPPGVPIQADPNPAKVHFSLALQRSCRTQNSALYAAKKVSVGPDGKCESVASFESAGFCSETEGKSASSTIVFKSLYNGDPYETDDNQTLIESSFEVYLADPHETCPGGLGPPPPCRGHLVGDFRFHYKRGRPAQVFP